MILLRPVSWLYASLMRLREAAYRSPLAPPPNPIPVISVGNLSLGGTGKTPVVEYVLQFLLDAGCHPAMVSRGYGRTGSAPAVVSHGQGPLLNARQAGDEPRWIAERFPGIPVIVDAKRRRGVRTAATLGADLVVLDDGFQHLACARDLNIVLVDAMRSVFDDRVLPEGRLRESRSALRRADLVLLTRADLSPEAHDLAQRLAATAGCPVLRTRFVFDRWKDALGEDAPLPDSAGSAMVVSGIGNPASFEAMLARDYPAWQWCPLRFGDHHVFTSADLDMIARHARDTRSLLVVTTAKDIVKMRPLISKISDLDIRFVTLRLEILDEAGSLHRRLLEISGTGK